MQRLTQDSLRDIIEAIESAEKFLPNYPDPDLDVLWDIVTGDLRTLLTGVRDVLGALPAGSKGR